VYRSLASIYHRARLLVQWAEYSVRGIKFFFGSKSTNPSSKSQFGQDEILEQLGLLTEAGVFVEVGANHPVRESNSWYLEHVWGYSGMSIDVIDYAAEYKQERPRTKFLRTAIDPCKTEVTFFEAEQASGWEDMVSSIHHLATETGGNFNFAKKTVPAMPLSKALSGFSAFDALLLDVEGHEIEVLKSIDWAQTHPNFILAENNGCFFPRKKLEAYLDTKGYRLAARIGTTDDVYIKNN